MALDEVALVKNLPGGSDQSWERYQRSQRYSLSAIANCTPLTTLAITAGRLYAVPFLLSGTHQFIRIGIYVGTLSAGQARLGIYANQDGDVYPGALILDAGFVDVGTTGLKEIVISQQLSPGLYWLALVGNSAPTLRAVAVAGAMPILGLDNAFNITPGNGWYVAFTYAALPNPFTGGGTVNTASLPAVALLKQ
jgi:hypothetical protein